MLKPDDPAWAELVAEIKAVVFSRGDDGYAFTSLHRCEQWDFFKVSGFSDRYVDQGMTEEQVTTTIRNALEGKPQENWLDGVLDGQALENRRIGSFKASVENMKNRPDNPMFEEMNGDRLPWAELSAAAKLRYIALDAARHDVPFEAFAQVVKETINDAGEASLRVSLEGQKELHAIATLLLSNGRIEITPLVEQVKEILDYASTLERQETERQQGREKLFEGINNILDGKPPQGLVESVKAFRAILRENRPIRAEAKSQDRGSREM